MTIADVARLAGVSPMTVSRVINASAAVAGATRDRVQAAMAELGYLPNYAARSLVVRRLGVIAFVMPDLGNPFFSGIARTVEGVARAHGLTVIFANTDGDLAVETDYIGTVISLGVDGVLLVPTGDRSAKNVEQLERFGKPVVLVDRNVRGTKCDVVMGESRRAAAALTEHLIGHGHTRIGMLSGPKQTTTGRERARGWQAALTDHGLAPRPELLRHAEYLRSAGYKETSEFLSQLEPPTAIVAANNFLAFGASDAAHALDLRIPDDVALVGFDDVEITPGEPTMTCANQPVEEIGRSAMELLLSRMGDADRPAEKVVVEFELRIRHTCGC